MTWIHQKGKNEKDDEEEDTNEDTLESIFTINKEGGERIGKLVLEGVEEDDQGDGECNKEEVIAKEVFTGHRTSGIECWETEKDKEKDTDDGDNDGEVHGGDLKKVEKWFFFQ